MPLSAGTKLGPYEIITPLGTGGMGEVYRARDTRPGRDVAIKVLSPHLSASLELKERFEREARAISSLNHARICTLHDDYLKPHAAVLKVAHPLMLRAIAAARKKNDRIDAGEICDCLRCDFLPECYMPSTAIRERRRTLRYRNLLVRQMVQLKIKISSLLMEAGGELQQAAVAPGRPFPRATAGCAGQKRVPATGCNASRVIHGGFLLFCFLSSSIICSSAASRASIAKSSAFMAAFSCTSVWFSTANCWVAPMLMLNSWS
jgi:hypothetical protein